MSIGGLNRRVQVWKNNLVENEITLCNELVPELKKTVWASITPKTGTLLSGREAGTMLSKTTHVIKVRVKSVASFLSSDCWLVYTDPFGNSHRYNIDYILDPYQAHDLYEIFVQEVV